MDVSQIEHNHHIFFKEDWSFLLLQFLPCISIEIDWQSIEFQFDVGFNSIV